MKLANFNEWFSLVANLGVLIGVFLLAYELQQSRLAAEAQTRSDIAALTSEALQRYAENPQIVEAFVKISDGVELTREEDFMMTYLRVSEIRRWENAYYQYERGLFSESEFVAMSERWKSRINSSLYDGFLTENMRRTYSESFIEYLDTLIER